MRKSVRILIGAGCCVLLAASWIITVNSKSTAEKQLILIGHASTMINDGIYVSAVPLLEEAAGYEAAHTLAAENELKGAYLALIDNRGYPRRYTTLLEKQMNRRDAAPSVFIEAANYYITNSKTQEALAVLRTGIEKTGDADIITLYENSRYVYEVGRVTYENVTATYGKTIQVQLDGKWGIANSDGSIMIPCEYDKVSTFNKDRTIVKKEGSIYAVDRDNNRVAVAHGEVSDFGHYADNRIPLLIEGRWQRATGDFVLGANTFEEIGMYSGGYAAAKVNGKWGVIDLSTKWLIPPEFDEVIRDELGRCYAQGAVFVRTGGLVYLIVDGDYAGDVYEDACPFSDEGFAAVKKNGKWGFIDSRGVEVIQFVFDEALSFGQHLAAVKHGEFWGYISKYGHIVIDAVFLEAKSFSDGSAPVLTERGWQFITIMEFKKGASL